MWIAPGGPCERLLRCTVPGPIRTPHLLSAGVEETRKSREAGEGRVAYVLQPKVHGCLTLSAPFNVEKFVLK